MTITKLYSLFNKLMKPFHSISRGSSVFISCIRSLHPLQIVSYPLEVYDVEAILSV